MSKIKIPKDYDTLKIIRAFNERLRVARLMYGEASTIVKKMIDRAKMVDELEWSKSGKTISKSKKNINAINTSLLKNRVIKFIQNNSAVQIIKNLVSAKSLREWKSLPVAERNQKIADRAKTINNLVKVLEKIFNELYNIYGWDAESCKEVYNELKTGQYMDLLNDYIEGKISADELGRQVIMGDDLVEYEDFDPDEEDAPEGGFNE